MLALGSSVGLNRTGEVAAFPPLLRSTTRREEWAANGLIVDGAKR